MNLLSLTQSTRDWTPAERRRTAILYAILGLGLALLAGPRLADAFNLPDTDSYLHIAVGQPAMLPFASRQLGPLLVRSLVHLFGVSVHTAYYLEGTASLLVFYAIVLWFLLRSGAPRFVFPAIACLFFWASLYNGLVLPDLFYGALLCLFLLCLDRRRFYLAALMMLPLAVARESTMLTLVCFFIAGWRRLRLAEAAVAIVSTAAGLFLVKRLAANALPNNEHISPLLYLVAKMPWNFFKNFLGISPWANVYRSCEVPRWQTTVHLGPLHAIGTCGFDPLEPMLLLFAALASFGLLPLLLLAVRRLPKSSTPAESPRAAVFLRFCIGYGALSFVIAGLLGESFPRLFAYSWPLFLVALPILLTRTRATFTSGAAAAAFLAIHLLLSWCGASNARYELLLLEIALWIAGYLLLRRTITTA